MPKCDAKTRYIPATFAWTLLIVATTLFFYYPAQYYLPRHPWVPACQGVITFFVLANFTLATFMDPGIIPKAPPDEDRDDDFRAPLYKNAEINGITVRMKWCVTCKFYRPPRCSHCSVCNHCIESYPRKIKTLPRQCVNACTSLELVQQRHASAHRRIFVPMLEEIQRSIQIIEGDVVVVGAVVAAAVRRLSSQKSYRELRALDDYYRNIVYSHLQYFGLSYNNEAQNIVKALREIQIVQGQIEEPPLPPPSPPSPPTPPPPKRRRMGATAQAIQEAEAFRSRGHY